MTVVALRPSAIGSVRDALMDLYGQHRRDGALPTSARFLFYELLTLRVLSKEKNGARRPDQILHDALTQLRESGDIPWDDIVDETRSVEDYTGYASVLDGVGYLLPSVQLDPWSGGAPFVLTESRSLAGVLRGIVSEFRARISSTNGQCGGFLRTDVGPLLRPGDNVGYLGDYDLAGGQIEDNTRSKLEEIVGGELNWTRIALTQAQVDEYSLPKIRKTDRRYKDGGGEHEAVETEALSQVVLTGMLRDWLTALLPEPLESVKRSSAVRSRAFSASRRKEERNECRPPRPSRSRRWTGHE
jgi:hypothetical protein